MFKKAHSNPAVDIKRKCKSMKSPTGQPQLNKSNRSALAKGLSGRLNRRQCLVLGLMLFGLFFGAGNTIFPVRLGFAAGPDLLPAVLGFLLTGIGLPLLGVISFALAQTGDLPGYAGVVGRPFALAYSVALFLTIGPLFAIPRTATVAFELTFPELPAARRPLPLFLFSLAFFALALYLALKPAKLMPIIGKLLTPLFLVLISLLLVTVFLFPANPVGLVPAQASISSGPFLAGLTSGYDTMDALASLTFGSLVITNLKALGVHEPGRRAVETLKSGLIMLVTMSVIYSSLSYLGATTAGLVAAPTANGGQILALVSRHYFGWPGHVLLAAIITVACLKTAIGLIASVADMFRGLFPRLKGWTYRRWVALFALLSFAIANFGLDKILVFSEPVLLFLYPLTIVLICFHLLHCLIPLRPQAFQLTLILTGLVALPEALKKVSLLAATPFWKNCLAKLTVYLPLFDQGFGWLIPAGLGLGISLLWLRQRPAENIGGSRST